MSKLCLHLHHLSTPSIYTESIYILCWLVPMKDNGRWRASAQICCTMQWLEAVAFDLQAQKSTDQLASLHHGPWPVLSIVQKHPKDCAVGASPGKKSAKIALLVLSYTARPIPISR